MQIKLSSLNIDSGNAANSFINEIEIVDTKEKIPDVSDKLLLSKLEEGVYTSVTNLKLLKNSQIDINLSDVKSIEKSLNENQHTLD